MIYDKVGTRYYRAITSCMFFLGCFCCAVSQPGTEYLLKYGSLIALPGGMAVYTTNLKIPSLYPKKQGLLIALVNGGLEASACVFLISKFTYLSYGLQASHFWWAWLAFGLVFMNLRTIFFMPKLQFVEEQQKVSEEMKEPEKEKLQPSDDSPEITALDCIKQPKYCTVI